MAATSLCAVGSALFVACVGTIPTAFWCRRRAGFLYFGPPAMVLSLLVALLVGWAAWLARS